MLAWGERVRNCCCVVPPSSPYLTSPLKHSWELLEDLMKLSTSMWSSICIKPMQVTNIHNITILLIDHTITNLIIHSCIMHNTNIWPYKYNNTIFSIIYNTSHHTLTTHHMVFVSCIDVDINLLLQQISITTWRIIKVIGCGGSRSRALQVEIQSYKYTCM